MPTVHFDVRIMTNPQKDSKVKRGGTPDSVLHPGSPNDPFKPKSGPVIDPIVKGHGAQPDSQDSQSGNLANCGSQITPACLRALYNLPNATLQKSSYGIVEYTPQAYLQSDLNLFYATLAESIPDNTAPIFSSVDGGVEQTANSGFSYYGETALDLEYSIALGKEA